MKREFKTKRELFKYLVQNKADLVSLKKAVPKFSDVVSMSELSVPAQTTKAAKYDYENDDDKGVLKRTIVANTYYWMDSHDDVHIPGVFSESIKQRGTKFFHLDNHRLSFDARVGKLYSVEERDISWRELGHTKTGMTQALVVASEIRKAWNETLYEAYLNDEVDQHSVGMQYVNIALAINDEEEFPREYEEWTKHIAKLGNRSRAEEKGYFWAVYEAKLIEVSAVLLGSNELTPTLGNKLRPSETLEFKVSPPESSRKGLLEALNRLKLNCVLENGN